MTMCVTSSLRKFSSPLLKGPRRFMSVINISDLDATTKFQELNHKVGRQAGMHLPSGKSDSMQLS
jgi:hypothetical protein